MPKTRQVEGPAPIYPAGAPHAAARFAGGARIGVHQHTEGQLIYAASGALATRTARGTWVASAHRLTWTPPGFAHSHRRYGGSEIHVVVIPAALCGRLASHPHVFKVSPLLREAVLALTDRRQVRPDAYARLRSVVIDELVEISDESLDLPQPTDDRLRAVTELLYADPAQTTTLAQLGRAVGASERTLIRLFHSDIGMSFVQWRTLLRVHHALAHLADGLSVTETSTACGWSNPTSFIDAFTAVIGQTPGQYQAELQQQRISGSAVGHE